MSGRLAGKKTLITAATQGIGRATALAFAAEGAEVWATATNSGRLAELDGTMRIKTRRIDVRRGDEVAAAAAEIGAVDVLFNCAGEVHTGTILECSEEDWDSSFELNVRGMYLMIRAFLPLMLERGGGSIINMASVISSIAGVPKRSVYGATKGAVIGLTKSIALDFAARGIRCNAICPGSIVTPSLEARIAAQPEPEAARATMIGRHAVGRLGTAEEVAEACVYLASDAAAFTTGTALVVDGGLSL
jgi:2-keto-3-deoxy-L-fuconate dehydrogenase